jgi:hypothetical protein
LNGGKIGLGYASDRRAVRNWLGNWAKVHNGLYAPLAHRLDRGVHDYQPLVTRHRHEIAARLGAVGTVLLGIELLGEPANSGRLLSVGLIIAGIVGLKLSTPT